MFIFQKLNHIDDYLGLHILIRSMLQYKFLSRHSCLSVSLKNHHGNLIFLCKVVRNLRQQNYKHLDKQSGANAALNVNFVFITFVKIRI